MFNRSYVSIPAALCVSSLFVIAGCGDPDPQATTDAADESSVATTVDASEEQASDNPGSRLSAQPPQSSRNDAVTTIDSISSSRSDRPRTPSSDLMIVAEPTVLDLGDMATGETKSGTVTLRNTGDRPMTVRDSTTSCGCTVANVPKGEQIAPGESVDVQVSLRGGNRPERLSKTVTFIIDEQPNVTVRVEGNAIAYVTVEPAIINPDQLPENQLTVSSHDGEPFLITAVHPRIIENLPEEPATEHVLTVSWDRWEESGQPRRLLFTTDHSKATQLTAAVRVPASHAADRDPTVRQVRLNPEVLLTQNRISEFLERLNDDDVDVEATDRNGTTLIGIAAKAGSTEAVQALIDAGADLEATDRNGGTPLMHAARSKNAEAVRLLIDAGANVDVRDHTLGNSALSWAAGFGDAASVRELIDAGAQVEVVSSATGFTPLILAAGFGEAESIAMLLDAGADVEAVDTLQSFTAIMYSASTGKVDNIRELVKGGANLEAKDSAGRTVLLIAAGAAGANSETIQTLLDAGADVSAVCSSEKNALEHAQARTDARRDEVVAVLEPVFLAQN